VAALRRVETGLWGRSSFRLNWALPLLPLVELERLTEDPSTEFATAGEVAVAEVAVVDVFADVVLVVVDVVVDTDVLVAVTLAAVAEDPGARSVGRSAGEGSCNEAG
jgi:hypothetical protein